MSFGGSPPPMMIPPTPAPAMQMTQPTSVKPQRKAQQPTAIGEALTPGQRETGGRSLIGGAPTALGR
jgi:hypothetical protein